MVIDQILAGIGGVSAYQDDIIIYTESQQSHKETLRKVLQALQQNGITLKEGKCDLAAKDLKFLGYIISHEGIKMDPENIKPILEAEEPKTLTQVRRWLGMVNFYHRFIKNLAELEACLTDLSRKGVRFHWGEVERNSFNKIKEEIAKFTVLNHLDLSKQITLYTDASDRAIGAVLMQEEKPIMYHSQKLTESDSKRSAFERELYAIYSTLSKWEKILRGRQFIIKTDQQSLVSFLKGSPKYLPNSRITWVAFISEFDFKIEHISGKDNNIADVLSRSVATIIDLRPVKTEVLSELQRQDKDIQRLQSKGDTIKANGLLCRSSKNEMGYQRNQIILPKVLQSSVIKQTHDQAHQGEKSMLKILKQTFYWEGMEKDVHDHIQQCMICRKQDSPKDKGSLKSSNPSYPFEFVSLDVTYMPKDTGGYQFILTIVDHFTKWAEMIPIKSIDQVTVAEAFKNEFITRYGYPRYLITDRGKENLNKVMRKLLQEGLVEHRPTTAYHPQANAVAERLHKTIKDWIKKLANIKEWRSRLQGLMHQYRITPHSSTNVSPYFALFGRESITTIQLDWPETNQNNRHWSNARSIRTANKIRQGIRNRAERNKKDQYQTKHKDILKIGDWVMIKSLQGSKWSSNKGPYKIMNRNQNNIVKITSLPNGPRLGLMHPIIHVSRLIKVPKEEQEEEELEQETTPQRTVIDLVSDSEDSEQEIDSEEILNQQTNNHTFSKYGRKINPIQNWRR